MEDRWETVEQCLGPTSTLIWAWRQQVTTLGSMYESFMPTKRFLPLKTYWICIDVSQNGPWQKGVDIPTPVQPLAMPIHTRFSRQSIPLIFTTNLATTKGVQKTRNILFYLHHSAPSVLWRCWLGVRKGIRPVKNWVVGCWRGCLHGVQTCI